MDSLITISPYCHKALLMLLGLINVWLLPRYFASIKYGLFAYLGATALIWSMYTKFLEERFAYEMLQNWGKTHSVGPHINIAPLIGILFGISFGVAGLFATFWVEKPTP